jgi:hypothetical protein
LAHDQTELSNKFARTHDNKFAEIDHIIPECDAPVLSGTAPHFRAATNINITAATKSTLLFCRGKYMLGEPVAPT